MYGRASLYALYAFVYYLIQQLDIDIPQDVVRSSLNKYICTFTYVCIKEHQGYRCMYVGINVICCIQLGSLKAYKSQYYELMAKIFLFIYVTCSFSVFFFLQYFLL